MRLPDTKNLRKPLRGLAAIAVTLVGTLALVAAVQAASSLTVASYTLKSASSRDEMRQVGKGNCDRGGSSSAFRFKIGKKTKECFYRVPVVGKSLEISASARLFKSTPKKVRPQAYVAVNLRQASDGSRYQLSIFPSGRRYQVKKVFPNGKIEMLGNGKAGNKINGFDEANKISLQAYNGVDGADSGTARILAVANGKKLAVLDDPRGNELVGQDSTFSMGSKRNATGAIGSFTSIVIRMPDPN